MCPAENGGHVLVPPAVYDRELLSVSRAAAVRKTSVEKMANIPYAQIREGDTAFLQARPDRA